MGKDKNNGAVILIKPKRGNNRGEAFIATGYGLEGRINDAYAGRIVRNVMIPYFVEEDYFGGVNAAVDEIIKRLSGEFSADLVEIEGPSPAIIFLLFIVIFFLIILISRGGGDQHIDSSGHRRGGHPPIYFPPMTSGHRRGGGFSGGFGGGLGGFGGGGGGSFGGGGAGGSW